LASTYYLLTLFCVCAYHCDHWQDTCDLVLHIIADAPPPSFIRVQSVFLASLTSLMLSCSQNTHSIQKLIVLLVPRHTSTVLSLALLPTTENPNLPIAIPLPSTPPVPVPSSPPDLPFSLSTLAQRRLRSSMVASPSSHAPSPMHVQLVPQVTRTTCTLFSTRSFRPLSVAKRRKGDCENGSPVCTSLQLRHPSSCLPLKWTAEPPAKKDPYSVSTLNRADD